MFSSSLDASVKTRMVYLLERVGRFRSAGGASAGNPQDISELESRARVVGHLRYADRASLIR